MLADRPARLASAPTRSLLAVGFLVGCVRAIGASAATGSIAFGIAGDPAPRSALLQLGDRHGRQRPRRRPGVLRGSRWAASTSSTSRKKLSPQGGGRAARARPGRGSTQLRLTLGGLIGERRARPAGLRAVRGLGRLGQGRRDQAAGRAARPAPRARRPVRGADPRREAPPLPLALLAVAARAGAGWPSSTAPGTAGCWSSGSRGSRPASSGCAPTTRSTTSSAPSPTRG